MPKSVLKTSASGVEKGQAQPARSGACIYQRAPLPGIVNSCTAPNDTKRHSHQQRHDHSTLALPRENGHAGLKLMLTNGIISRRLDGGQPVPDCQQMHGHVRHVLARRGA